MQQSGVGSILIVVVVVVAGVACFQRQLSTCPMNETNNVGGGGGGGGGPLRCKLADMTSATATGGGGCCPQVCLLVLYLVDQWTDLVRKRELGRSVHASIPAEFSSSE